MCIPVDSRSISYGRGKGRGTLLRLEGECFQTKNKIHKNKVNILNRQKIDCTRKYELLSSPVLKNTRLKMNEERVGFIMGTYIYLIKIS